jgi:hypothetical protein
MYIHPFGSLMTARRTCPIIPLQYKFPNLLPLNVMWALGVPQSRISYAWSQYINHSLATALIIEKRFAPIRLI